MAGRERPVADRAPRERPQQEDHVGVRAGGGRGAHPGSRTRTPLTRGWTGARGRTPGGLRPPNGAMAGVQPRGIPGPVARNPPDRGHPPIARSYVASSPTLIASNTACWCDGRTSLWIRCPRAVNFRGHLGRIPRPLWSVRGGSAGRGPESSVRGASPASGLHVIHMMWTSTVTLSACTCHAADTTSAMETAPGPGWLSRAIARICQAWPGSSGS